MAHQKYEKIVEIKRSENAIEVLVVKLKEVQLHSRLEESRFNSQIRIEEEKIENSYRLESQKLNLEMKRLEMEQELQIKMKEVENPNNENT